MKRLSPLSGLIAVVLLIVGVIWPCQGLAVAPPALEPLGQIANVDGMGLPAALDVDSSGNLFVADARNGNVNKFDQYGRHLGTWQASATGRGIAVDESLARVFVALNKKVSILDAETGAVIGELVGGVNNGPEFGQVGPIAFDAEGNVFVADTNTAMINVYSSGGVYLNSFGGPGETAGTFLQIGGMEINPAGQVVVVDSSGSNNQVHVFTMDSGTMQPVSVAGYAGSNTSVFGTLLYNGRGVAFDSLARGYFLEYFKSAIHVTSSAFVSLSKYSNEGVGVGQLYYVKDVAYDTLNNRLFVSAGNRIEIFGIDGAENPVHVNSAPTTPQPLSPAAGSVVDTAQPTLLITNATDADGDALTYQVVVSQGGQEVWGATVPAEEGDITQVPVDAALTENAEFSWTVQAFDAETSSAVSAPTSFFVNAINDPPTTPLLIAPTFVEDVVAGGDALMWGASTDPDPGDDEISYSVEVATDPGFTDLVATATTTATAVLLGDLPEYSALQLGASYFWRVSALDPQAASDASPAGEFTYDTNQLVVSANMPGAAVSLSGNHAYAGRLVGEAPVELRDLVPGTYSVVVERPGFEPDVSPVVIGEQGSVAHYVVLAPAEETTDVRAEDINGSKALRLRSLTGPGMAAPFVVDYDNDGRLDLLVGDGDGQVQLFAIDSVERRGIEISGAGALDLPVMAGPVVPFVADWNNDDRKDLIVGLADGTVQLFENTGTDVAPAYGAGAQLTAVGVPIAVGSAAAPLVADFNGDDLKDLLVGNAVGDVRLFENIGTDATPVLAEGQTVLNVGSAVVPFSVDWDADGSHELALTFAGRTTIYKATADGYQPDFVAVDTKKGGAHYVAFPLNLNGNRGMDFLVGQADGKLFYLEGRSNGYVASYAAAIQDKFDQLETLVAEEAPGQLDNVRMIREMYAMEAYSAVDLSLDLLIGSLGPGAAQTCAIELKDLI